MSGQPVPALGGNPQHPRVQSGPLRPAQFMTVGPSRTTASLAAWTVHAPDPAPCSSGDSGGSPGATGMVGNSPTEVAGPGDICSGAAGGGWGRFQQEQGTLRIPDHRHPSVHPAVAQAQFNQGLPVPPSSPLCPWGDRAMSLGGRQGGLTAAQVVLAVPGPRVWLGKARHVPSVGELALQVVGIETAEGCNTSPGLAFIRRVLSLFHVNPFL